MLSDFMALAFLTNDFNVDGFTRRDFIALRFRRTSEFGFTKNGFIRLEFSADFMV
jgi:hypothetical protein